MAGGADEGLAPPFGHGHGPLGLRGSGCGRVFELADMVNFRLSGLPADLAGAREEPGEQFLVRSRGR